MKKVLLGTTALVAASFVASAAMADEMMAEPLSASIGGHYFVALGIVNGNDGAGEPREDMHSTLMAQDLQLVFSGSTTLDNGMTVSLTAKMDSSKNTAGFGGHTHSGDDVEDISSSDVGNAHWDERFITIGGAFGRLQLGSVESARQQTTTFAPSAAGMMGLNTPFFTFAGAIARYDDGIGAEDALKAVYFTPAINGFSIGVSYAPEDSGGSQYGGSSKDVGTYQNHMGVGATVSQEFAGGNVGLSAGYETYEAEVPAGMSCVSAEIDNCEPETVQFGVSMSFGDYSFGGGWQESDESETTKSSVMDFGVGWGSGPISLAAMYGQASTEASNGDSETTRYGVNGSYALGAGVDLQAQLDFGEVDAAGPNDPAKDYEWVQFMIGTAIGF